MKFWELPYPFSSLIQTILSKLIHSPTHRFLFHKVYLIDTYPNNYPRLQNFIFRIRAVYCWGKLLYTFSLTLNDECFWLWGYLFLQLCLISIILYNSHLVYLSKVLARADGLSTNHQHMFHRLSTETLLFHLFYHF